jgi:hypothetical protein
MQQMVILLEAIQRWLQKLALVWQVCLSLLRLEVKMAVSSRQGLKEYCLRELGAPVVEINVDDDQLEDRIDEALEYWRQYHYDGIEKIYMKHQVTATDIVNRYIPVNDLVYGVTRVFPIISSTTTSKSIFDLQYQLRLNDLYDLTSTSIIYYKTVMNHLALLDNVLNGSVMYRFNRLQDRLHIDIDWGTEVTEGQFILVEAYRVLDPTTFPKVWNEQWLKHYTSALFKKQWGTNLKKFNGLQLPGGVTIDGDGLYREAIEEMRMLEDNLQNKSAPLEFFMG